MKKHLIAFLALLLPLPSCGPTSDPTSEYQPKNDLERIFQSLKSNNFTIDMNTSLMMHNKVNQNVKYYYTDYSIQAEGDIGFYGYAQKDDYIFRYSLLDGEVISGTPMINSGTGLRYSSLYEFKKGMDNFDISLLPDEKDEDGYYTYQWGNNKINDGIFLELFHSISASSIPPEQTKIKVIGDTIEIKTIILDYSDVGDLNNADTLEAYIYDINETKNAAILEYLEKNGDAKKPLDNTFFRTINPYLTEENYTVHLDSTNVKLSDGSYSDFKADRFITKNSVVYKVGENESGLVLFNGAVSQFYIENERLNIEGTPVADSNGNFYTSIVGGAEPYYFGQLDYSLFVGYKTDDNENVYVLSDTYLLNVLSSICLVQLYEEMYADYAIFEVVDADKHEFNLYFDLYNKITNVELGRYVAQFRNQGTTKIEAVDRFFFKGDDPKEQQKSELETALNLFKEGNYSMDSVTSVGATKYFYTENYMFVLPYTSTYKNLNYGYIKYNGGIYEFTYNFSNNTVLIDTDVDYSKGENGLKLPGTGATYFGADDLGYVSHLSDEIYNFDNYVVEYKNGQNYWKNNSTSFSKTVFDYYKTYSNILPTGSGFIVNVDENDSYNTRITIVSNFITNDGLATGKYEYTYYDIGNTSFKPLDDFLGLN